MIRWWEALRAPEVVKWQQTYRIDWDATDGRSGGAQRTVWEVLMEMESFHGQAGEEEPKAVVLVSDLAKALESVFQWCWPGRRIFSFPRKMLRVLCGIASCGFLEDELRQCSKEGGVTMADSVETLGVDLRTRVKNSGAKEEARRKTCNVRFSLIKKNKAFQKNCLKVGGQEVAACRHDASKNMGNACSRDGSQGKV